MKELKSKKGITLIALVITIIVLLILAAVSISAIVGDNGIVSKAKKAEADTIEGQEEEYVDLVYSSIFLESKTEGMTEEEQREAMEKELKKLAGDEAVTVRNNGDGTLTVKFTETGKEYPVDIVKSNDGETDKLDWDAIKADVEANYDEYLAKAQAQGQTTKVDIGIGTDGEIVNLDLWNYYVTDDGTGISLGKGDTSQGTRGYDEVNLNDDGTIQGKMPQYIYKKSEDKEEWIGYDVTMLKCTFMAYSGVASKLSEIPEIPFTVTSIGNYAFYLCEGLTSITIPSSVTSIGSSVFSYCTGLTSVTIESGVTSIGSSAFYGCTGLTSVTIPDSVTSIGNYAFKECKGLTSVTIGSGVTSIGGDAFYGCKGLTSITIPSSVISIENSAFSGCRGLTNIKVDEANTTYDSRDNCNAIIEKATNTLIIGCQNTAIPSSVTSIGNSAFSERTGLSSIEIPSSVTSIGVNAFYRCTGLTSIELPDSVTNIGNAAFYGCTGLTSVTIPSSVTSIGNYAFSGCTGLTTVYFEQTTSPTFGSSCFRKTSGDKTTFYFKNSTVADAFTNSHYNSSYGTKSTDYSW